MKEIITIDPQYKGIEEKLKLLTLDSSVANKFSSSYRKQQNFVLSSVSSQGKTTSIDNKEKLVAELDQIISSECIHCGSLLAAYIDKPAPVGSDPIGFTETSY